MKIFFKRVMDQIKRIGFKKEAKPPIGPKLCNSAFSFLFGVCNFLNGVCAWI